MATDRQRAARKYAADELRDVTALLDSARQLGAEAGLPEHSVAQLNEAATRAAAAVEDAAKALAGLTAPAAELTEAQKYAESIIRSARQFDHGDWMPATGYVEPDDRDPLVVDALADALCEAFDTPRPAYRAAVSTLEALNRKGYTVAPRASQAAGGPHGTGCGSRAASDPDGGSAGRTALREKLRALLEHMHLHEYDPDDYDAQADAITAMVDTHTEQAIRKERQHLATMLHERAQQSRTLTHRTVFGIASRLVAPDVTPEDIERAILDGNFVVCDIPEDPAS